MYVDNLNWKRIIFLFNLKINQLWKRWEKKAFCLKKLQYV